MYQDLGRGGSLRMVDLGSCHKEFGGDRGVYCVRSPWLRLEFNIVSFSLTVGRRDELSFEFLNYYGERELDLPSLALTHF